ncbi:F0F1 ATP synthase subunit A [Mesomycoplasma ovipneumoniae]|uniref:F0F1 ATP synthase subunit A n=1 Tax=Mesomycoplasma ovipneumoniae TaxID=29562 RepID=UPI002964266A|nr:F0F1 ATP synthase subunit A [Mesomycoplasma ovipneumoniae]MDW2907764.1 F0F1 ATP synthase subunit A [Mesomycoplasma ovipneumoniae]MDW2911315.1 F0F1 ATP synthase subunit A [Mesomycoplasma ovipneumoniae]MDW2911825.1 F0F1 ATP synthase subunit A [Mesomycoplasma ovipneumoniae]MDW2919631.1 F0F1 ATP synthase subunit A [Mesomycoplasma ovipneumoniae]MDW2928236.1 F0F1 ATP synthase subunit A [Mesomycoplasma ovipneumoniae]
MDFFSHWNQPQLFTLFILVIFAIILSIIIFFHIKKAKVDKAPSAIVLFAESYFLFIDDLVESSGEGYVNKAKPYVFSLFTFFLLGNLLSLAGLEPISTSISVTLSLAIISWLGIFVVGSIFAKRYYILEFAKNPLKIIGAPAPLISLSFRMYGNIISGSVFFLIIYSGVLWLYQKIPLGAFGNFNLPVVLIFPPFLIYFDIIGSLIQSFIFVILTVSYWGMEVIHPPQKQKTEQKTLNIVQT